jgi:hypothetical protein
MKRSPTMKISIQWLPIAVVLLLAGVPAQATTHSSREHHIGVGATLRRMPVSGHASHSSAKPARAHASARSPRALAHTRQTGSSSPSASPAPQTSTGKRRHRRPREVKQKAPTADRISEIQSALSRGGYYQGDPNGRWDTNTISAMRKFQSASGLDPTGKLDALSLQKLGLGSDIAGVSAPKPVPPPGSATPTSGAPAPATVQPQPKTSSATPTTAP